MTCPPGVVTRPNQVPGKHSSRRSLCVVEDAAPLAQRARGSPAMIGRFRRRELRRGLHDPGTRLARTQSRPLDRLLHDFFADCVCRETASFTVRQRRREFSIRPVVVKNPDVSRLSVCPPSGLVRFCSVDVRIVRCTIARSAVCVLSCPRLGAPPSRHHGLFPLPSPAPPVRPALGRRRRQ